jgi:hypothetical protein
MMCRHAAGPGGPGAADLPPAGEWPCPQLPFCGSYDCRSSKSMADHNPSSCTFAEFSLKWRTYCSHLRGGSYDRMVLHERGSDTVRMPVTDFSVHEVPYAVNVVGEEVAMDSVHRTYLHRGRAGASQ